MCNEREPAAGQADVTQQAVELPGYLKPTTISELRAALDVYGFTLEFVLQYLQSPSEPFREFVSSQIEAARAAYREVSGDEPLAYYGYRLPPVKFPEVKPEDNQE